MGHGKVGMSVEVCTKITEVHKYSKICNACHNWIRTTDKKNFAHFLVPTIFMWLFETGTLSSHAISKNVAVSKSDCLFSPFHDALMPWDLLYWNSRHWHMVKWTAKGGSSPRFTVKAPCYVCTTSFIHLFPGCAWNRWCRWTPVSTCVGVKKIKILLPCQD